MLRELELEALARQVEIGVVKLEVGVLEVDVLEVEVGVLAGLEVGTQGQTQLGWVELRLQPQALVQRGQLGMVVGAGKRQYLTLWGLSCLSVRTFLPVRTTIYLTWSTTLVGIATWTSSWRTAPNGILAMRTLTILSELVPQEVAELGLLLGLV